MGVSGVIAEFDASGNLLLYSNTQVPFLHKREFAEILGMDPGRIRIIQPPIGGGFGSKLDIYPFEPICDLPGEGDAAAGEARVHPRGGVHRLADAPAGAAEAALRLQARTAR